jgi:hypothetical protein
MRAGFRSIMAIEAGNLQIPGMLLMGERDGLLRFIAPLVARQWIALQPAHQDHAPYGQPDYQDYCY